MARKVIQLESIPSSDSSQPGFLYALCDDGTVWRRTDNAGAVWALVTAVPQDNETATV